uniref:Histidinol-phosphate aminotransferase n=1 Tax=uncultured bacterium UPO76 TaxID=1776993 RepID=A0A140DZZ2_9BACT|nr:histidinol-phosphate aminotransferase [uncultured bacterium UPO76]
MEDFAVANAKLEKGGATFEGIKLLLCENLGGHPKPAMHGHLKTGHREAERSGR